MSSVPSGARVTIVVPCFNEAQRLRPELVIAFRDEVAQGGRPVEVLLVDDGSTDGTGGLLDAIAIGEPGVSVLHLPRNVGKAEAVRAGLREAIDSGAAVVGFADADFATPPAEVGRLVRRCLEEELRVVIGSRVDLLGHHITRNQLRHYAGRVFGTVSSLVLGFAVYDTQCGAKVFATGPALSDALATPFLGRWSFDVELLGRLAAHGTDGFVEVPLLEWHEVGGSKLGFVGSVRATLELLMVKRALRRYRAGVTRRAR